MLQPNQQQQQQKQHRPPSPASTNPSCTSPSPPQCTSPSSPSYSLPYFSPKASVLSTPRPSPRPPLHVPNRSLPSSSAPTHQTNPLFRRLVRRNPRLARKLEEMRLPLSPLVHVCSGAPHPDFPQTILHYWLLTDRQLESLAHYYHQRTPGPYSGHYPCPIRWNSRWPLEEKRRQIGKFIGLPRCFTPVKSEREILEDIRRNARREEEEALFRGKMW